MSERTALIRAREKRGLTRPEFAKLMGGSRHYIYAIEMGMRDPSFEFMRRWVKALGEGATMELFGRATARPYTRGRSRKREWLASDEPAA
jgi:transcriptional regulator with XRE-family HTH domain